MGDFLMPVLGADMESGTILEWRVEPGDQVHHGDIVALVDTDKSDIEVEVFEDGVVEELLVEPGKEVPVGTPLARISPSGTSTLAPLPRDAAANPPAPRVRSSPLARRRAAELGVDLREVTGSGQAGAVLASDLSQPRAATVLPAAAGSTREQPAARRHEARQPAMRAAIAALMARSKAEIPHYYLATTIDLTAATAWLADENARRPIQERLLPAALLLKATAIAAREVPALNGFWRERFEPAASVHLGVAVSLRAGGLLAPAIHDADQLSVDDLMRALKDLVERARAGRLRSSEMSDPTLTVTDLGDRGADEVQGVIYPPQVAIVGFGRIAERPWASHGLIGARPTVRATLAADHRASDGHEGSKLLAVVDRLLQSPEEL